MSRETKTYKEAYIALRRRYESLLRDTNQKRLQFSQKMTLISAVFSMVFVVGVNAANFILLWHGKQPMAEETVTAMSIYGGITSTLTFGGYCALSGVRDCSLNKAKTGCGMEKDSEKNNE